MPLFAAAELLDILFPCLSTSLPLSVSRNPAENGFGPAPSGSADGDLSDGQLAALLPSLKQPDYYTEPSLQQVGPWPVCLLAVAVVWRQGWLPAVAAGDSPCTLRGVC